LRKQIFLSLALLAAAIAGSRAQAQVAVVANPSIKATQVNKADLRDVFTGASSSLAGTHATPVLLKSGPATSAFLSAYVGKTDAAFLASWRSLVFSGQASMPRSVDSDATVVQFVSSHPGAVGYIAENAPHEGVKVLAVK